MRRRSVAVGALAAATALLVSACGGSSGSSGGGGASTALDGVGPITLVQGKDLSGFVQGVLDGWNQQHPDQKATLIELPADADAQRQQMIQNANAKSDAYSVLVVDNVWTAEFAANRYIVELPQDQFPMNDFLPPVIASAEYKDKLFAVPNASDGGMLYYRTDLLQAAGIAAAPKTWAEMFADSKQLAKMGLPHLIEIQGAQYEGVTVWFNTMVNSAGGSLLNASSTRPGPIAPMVKALEIMHDLATSPAADPSLSVQMEDQNRLAMESGTAAFELNYPYVYPSMVADNPTVKTYNGKSLAKNFKWAQYPSVIPGKPARVTIGGIDLAISKYSPHPQLAFKAALCLRNKPHQLLAAIKGGLPPTLVSIYQNPPPAFVKAYPFYKEVFSSLQNASVRPKTPAYQNLSIVVSHSVSPPSSINPQGTANTIQSQTFNALASKGLVP